VGAKDEPDLLGRRRLVRDRIEPGVEGACPFRHGFVEQVLLGFDVRVERALLDSHRFGQVADRSAVVALLGEEPSGLPSQL
jgi:hypothetical protein